MIYQSILETIGRTPIVRINQTRAEGRGHVRQGRGVQSDVVGQGSPRHRHHSRRRSQGHAQARPDRGRGDVGQHRHRAGDGLRGEGLSVRCVHERFVLDRAAQADARTRRESDSHARPPNAPPAWSSAPRTTRRSMAHFSRASSRTRPIRPITAARPARKSCRISPASDWTGS